MTTDPSDLSNHLRAEAPAPAQQPAFFETLAVTAAQSTPTPTAEAALFLGFGRTKVVTVIAGTALLLSGAAYAGGLIGGGPEKHTSSAVPPAHHTSATPDQATNKNGAMSMPHPATHHDPAKHHHGMHGTAAKGASDPSPGPTAMPPTGTTPTGDECQHHGDPSTWWRQWNGWGHDHDGDQDGDQDGDHDGDGWHHGGGGSGDWGDD